MMIKKYVLIFVVNFSTLIMFSQKNFFSKPNSSSLSNAKEITKTIKNIEIFSLDELGLTNYLKNAPMEFKNNGITIPLEIPLPNGTTEIFNMVESPVLSPEIALQNPNIKTYTGNGTKNNKSVIRLSLTSLGFNAIILNVGDETVYFESYSNTRNNIYFNYFTKDLIIADGQKKSTCLNELDIDNHKSHSPKNGNFRTSTGSQLTTFKLAMAATAEFTVKYGVNAAAGFAAVSAYVNRIKAVFRNELAVDFLLVSGQNMVYTDAVTDPYTNSNQSTMLTENHNNCNTVLGNTNYDIGHVLGTAPGSGGGIASVGVVCNNSFKGRGVSGEGNLNVFSQVFMDQLLLHEMGHQFNMDHSFNSTIPVCTTRWADTSVEPGSGATIMSYGFTCGSDDYFSSTQTGPMLQYHTTNYEQAMSYLSGVNCGIKTNTSNTPPVVTVPLNYTIPKSTPFSLTGSATDVNNDALTYSWEGTNIGVVTPDSTTLSDTAQPPFFRSRVPSNSPTRTYPELEKILNGTNYGIGDKLPSVGIVTTHRLTVRDNNANGGGITNANVSVTVNGAIGPFLETTNLSGVYSGLAPQIITWSVNGTNAATQNVNILLSTDGGLTFPTTLIAGTPNDGSQTIVFPSITTTTARIKIESVGNIFFDISNSNFSINPPLLANVTGTNLTTIGGSNGTATATPSGGTITFNYPVTSNFTGAPFVSAGNGTVTFSTIVVPAIPAGSVFVGATLSLTNLQTSNGSYLNEIRAHLTGAYTLGATQVSNLGQGSTFLASITPINLAGFPSTGGTIGLQFSETFNDEGGTDVTIGGAFITVTYSKNGYTYVWSNGATTASINNLAAGTYNVTVSDASGATTTGNYTVTQPGFNAITATSGANGSISPSGITTITSGSNQSYTITPNACYQISSLFVNGISQPINNSFTFTNVTTNQRIEATFISIASTNNTAITSCSSYTWANNGQTYATSGTYNGNTTNCVTEVLNLTINSTTWSANAWSNGPPDATIGAVFSSNYTAAADLTACSLEVTGNATVNVPSGFDFTITNQVKVASNASLTFENNANLLQTTNSSNIGNIVSKRNTAIQRLAYTYWSSPVANQNALAFSPLTISSRFYTYNESTNNFVTVPSPSISILEPTFGYGIRAPNTFVDGQITSFVGTFTGIPNNGNYTFVASKIANGYNFIGNPYPSSMSTPAFFLANANVDALYFWNNTVLVSTNASDNYAVKNRTSGVRAASHPKLPSDFIGVGQGFFVKMTNAATIIFNNTMRTSENAPVFFRNSNTGKSLFKLNLMSPTNTFNQIAVGYLENATNGVDNQLDAVPFAQSNTMVSSLINNTEFVIQGRALPFVNIDVVPLSFKTDTAGNYFFTAEAFEGVFENNQNIFVKDNLAGITHNVKQTPYNFTTNAGVFNSRFEIVYQSTLDISNPSFNNNTVFVFQKENAIHINSGIIAMKKVEIFDIRGRKITEKDNINQTSTQLSLNVEQQVLLVKITNFDNETIIKKIVY